MESRPALRLAAYAARWLETIRPPAVRPRTWQSYEYALRLHVLPALGDTPLVEIRRPMVRALLAQKLAEGYAPETVRILHATLRALLSAAVDDELLEGNPAAGVGRRLGLGRRSRGTRGQRELRALTRYQLAEVLAAAKRAPELRYRRLWPLFLLLARAGLRIGEALALRWEDLDVERRTITVARAFSAGRLEAPKRDSARVVDMSAELGRALVQLRRQRERETRRRRWPALPLWVFCSTVGTPLDYALVRRAFVAARVRAIGQVEGTHFTPHSLRHTFAAHLLIQGESPVYVQRQLGHASIALTVDLYGCWFPMSNPAAVDRLDGPPGRRSHGHRM